MKRCRQFILPLLLSITLTSAYSQRLSLGAGSGFNFSDIHTSTTYGYWKSKPGPTAGLFADWQMTPVMGLHAGVDYATVYYEYHGYNLNYYAIGYYPEIWMPWIPTVQSSSFSFVTLPLQLTVTVPSKPALTLGAGAFYSFKVDQNPDLVYYSSQDDTVKNDLGFTYMMRLNYPLQKNLDLFVQGRYNTGRRLIYGYNDRKHGYSNLTVGLICRLGTKPDLGSGAEENLDEVNEDVYLTWQGGVNISRNSGNISKEKYSAYVGESAGFMINFRLGGSGTWFRTGLTLDRQGYSMRDSSNLFYLYYEFDNPDYFVDSRVSIDYAVIPALIDFHFGPDEIFSFSTGPYFAARLNARCTGTAMLETFNSGSYILEKTTIHDDLTELIRRNDFGWIAGAGVAIPLYRNLKIDLGIQYRQGLPEVFQASSSSSSSIPEPDNGKDQYIRNSTLTIHAGVRVPLYR